MPKKTNKPIYPINYLGHTYNTTIRREITNEEWQEVIREYYEKPLEEVVDDELRKVCKGRCMFPNITKYYFRELMSKVKVWYNHWSIHEALMHKPLVEFFAGKTDVNEKIFPKSLTLCQRIETAFRLCGFKTASKPSNYPMKSVDKVLEAYNINDVYYDFSCGWGSRMLSSLKHNIEYLGTDPNYELVDKLKELAERYNRVNGSNCKYDIRAVGSEELQEDWIGKVGVAFTSPPYYYLEDYKIGNQSYKEGVSYDEWKESYLRPTIENIEKYLVENGTMLINIKNFAEFTLVEDTIAIAQECGFTLCDTMELKNIHRCYGVAGHKEKAGFNNNNELIYVFKRTKEIENF